MLGHAVRRGRLIALTLVLTAIIGALGAWAAKLWPDAALLSRARDVIHQLTGAPSGAGPDPSGRDPVACPPAGERTMVALVFGQSHGSNLVKERFAGDAGVFNYFQGRCYRAADPLLGTDFGGGNVWTLVGNELLQRRKFDAVILVTASVSGSYIGQWAPGGRLHARLMDAVGAVGPERAFTHVFIQQGEADLMAGTPAEEYSTRFGRIIAALRQKGIGAPIFVAIESGYCDGAVTPPQQDNPITGAQKRVIAAHRGVYFGPDMDAALAARTDRYDGCHMSGTDARKLARLWAEAIATPSSERPPRLGAPVRSLERL
jgi:lysophospholipase L1-like esterase